MKLAVFMDPLERINPQKDTTIAMLVAAEQRGWACCYFTQQDLYSEQGQAFAWVTAIRAVAGAIPWARTAERSVKALQDFDIILIRKDPPFDLAYLYATQLLSLAEFSGVLVTNRPQSLRDMNEKLGILQYPDCCPPTLVAADIASLKAFWNMHRSVIFKPLSAMGGHNIFHVAEDGRNLSVILQQLTVEQTMPIMAQRYIPEISEQGDKRIILIGGQPQPHALARFAASGESRANLAAGGTGVVVPITAQDRKLCDRIGPDLRAKGLWFVGVDVIGDYITEINVTSPTCVREINAETGLDIAGDYLDFLAVQCL